VKTVWKGVRSLQNFPLQTNASYDAAVGRWISTTAMFLSSP